MALGIRTFDEIYTEYSIPLMWDNNQIVANHLRYLADEIEKLNKPILSMSLEVPIDYTSFGFAKPYLKVITLAR